MTEQKTPEKKWPQKQDVLNHIGCAGISLWQLEMILREYEQTISEHACESFFSTVDPGHGGRLVVGPHSDGSYKQVGSNATKALPDWLEACQEAMRNPAIDRNLPVWFERTEGNEVRHFAILPDDWRVEVRCECWDPESENQS